MRKTILALIVVATCSLANSSATKYKAEIKNINKQIEQVETKAKKDVNTLKEKRKIAEKNLAKAEGREYAAEEDTEKWWEDRKKEAEHTFNQRKQESPFL